MSHMNWKGFQNPPDEAKPKVKKPVGHTDDSHVKEFIMPNPPSTQPTRLGSGEEFGPEGQLTVKAAAELLRRGVEIAAAPVGEREGLIKATLANYVDPKMPPLHYAMCDCKDLPGYPQRWGGKP